jgi:hypothetical protein
MLNYTLRDVIKMDELNENYYITQVQSRNAVPEDFRIGLLKYETEF